MGCWVGGVVGGWVGGVVGGVGGMGGMGGSLVLGPWYQVLGTKYLVLIMIIPPFLISPFDRVQTTLFEDLIVSRHRIG